MPYDVLQLLGMLTGSLLILGVLWKSISFLHKRYHSKHVVLLSVYHFVSVVGRLFVELQIINKSDADDQIMAITAQLEKGQERQIGKLRNVYDLTGTQSHLADIMEGTGTAMPFRMGVQQAPMPLPLEKRDSRRLLATYDLPPKIETRNLEEGRTSTRVFGWVPRENVDCVVSVSFLETNGYVRGGSRYPFQGFPGSITPL